MKRPSPILRKDIASKQMLPKKDLIRIVKNKEGKIFIDLTHTAEGRGTYVKNDLQSFMIVKKHNLLSRGLKVRIDQNIYDELEKVING
ncbi:RNase P modulator RnpM [Mesoplasma seiffertii]|uniref:RNase P modulator RnpM n=1 Tax=Mesoplasma seiffertii TaxID=28224 RepID=UPI00047CD135|nr:YlxR family protein [Mesoplasma seiffertii]